MNVTTLTKPRQPAPPARTITESDCAAILEAASMAAPIGETEMQAFGSKTAWGQNVRPGRCEARRKFLCMMLRASELALAERPELEIRHVIAAIRSHALNTADLLVCPRTGKWLSKPNAVKSRGLELAGSLAELAMIIFQVESDACTNREDAR